jgi:hypothetical protein
LEKLCLSNTFLPFHILGNYDVEIYEDIGRIPIRFSKSSLYSWWRRERWRRKSRLNIWSPVVQEVSYPESVNVPRFQHIVEESKERKLKTYISI